MHIEVCDPTHEWPQEEKYELGSQARRSSNSASVQLAEESAVYGADDRHCPQGWPYRRNEVPVSCLEVSGFSYSVYLT